MGGAQLRRRLHALAWGEKQVLAGFLRHLEEFDHRRAYAPLGHSSLFRYCTQELGLSQDEAYLRIQAARLSRDHPQVLDMLARGETHLSSLAKLSPCLTGVNASELLEQARGKSKREVERIAAGYAASPPPRADTIRFLPPAIASPPAPAAELDLRSPVPGATAPTERAQRLLPTAQAQDTAAEPPRLVRIAFTASERLLSKIGKTKALLRHKHPCGRLELLVEEAFDALLAKKDPDRQAADKRLIAGHPFAPSLSRRVPRWVRREVWRRDGGRCTFVSSEGVRCAARDWLQYDHIIPFALGGSSTEPANIRLACGTHNRYAAQRIFGEAGWPRRPKGG